MTRHLLLFVLAFFSQGYCSQVTDHPCKRTCGNNAPPMTCRYTFKIEHYQTMSKACFDCPYNQDDCKRPNCILGGGYKRPVTVVNRQLPGPSIEVCQGDNVIVDVENLLAGETTTIHWHGYHHQKAPYMDGVPFVTQCPIQPTNTFRYIFTSDKAGTHFWHSHTGLQRADGAFGPFVVRQPKEKDPHLNKYDFDLSSHIIVVFDWIRENSIDMFVAFHHSEGNNKEPTLLVNGLGRFLQDEKNGNSSFTTPERFIVQKGFRYRFRLINAGFLTSPVEVSIDKHTLTVISTDGHDIAPLQVDSIVTYPGERFDFIVNANQEPGLYWIRFKGLLAYSDRYNSAYQVAVLQYESSLSNDYSLDNSNYVIRSKEWGGIQLNSLNVGTGVKQSVNVVELQSLSPPDPSLKKNADLQFIVSYDFRRIDNPHFHKPNLYGYHSVEDLKRVTTPQLNHISMKLLDSPLLPARDHINTSTFCNSTTHTNCKTTYCECPHVLQVPLNSVVELIVIDEGAVYDSNHPFHLHGYSFRVVGMERLARQVTEDTIRKLDKNETLKRNLVNPPLKDTVTIPDGGYTILRFYANNPGFWMFHCHQTFHLNIGMSLVFKVGENKEMLPIPPNFPQCGNYLPEFIEST